VQALVLDVDGVLTDGRLVLGPGGEEWKAFHVHDGLALARAVAAGFPVAVLSSRRSPATARRCADLGLTDVRLGAADKLAAYLALRRRRGWTDAGVAAMGDDLPDLPLMRRVGLAIAPADAVPEVRRAAAWVTRRPGGGGAVREALEAILRARGLWTP
jgi:3-deoxy-D-manno-octulosonate 8-phosphate phosphatase (KDO 8-P phosphatase)